MLTTFAVMGKDSGFAARLQQRMAELGKNPTQVGREMKARFKVGSQQTVDSILKRQSSSSIHVAELAAVLDTTPTWLLTGRDDYGSFPRLAEPTSTGMTEHLPKGRPPPPLASIPEYGTAAATDGHLEGLGTQYAVDFIDVRLPDDCFAVRVVGDSMKPRYMPGEILLIHPNKDAKELHDCLIETHDGKGYIKTYLKKTASKYMCQQYNPAEKWEIDKAKVKAIHAVRCRWG